MKNVSLKAIENSMSYNAYIELIEQLTKTNATTGPDQSEFMVNYTKLNYKRMTRLNKTIVVSNQLVEIISGIPFNMTWVVIAEAWCGDAAQNIPYIAKLAEASANVDLRIVLRDENPEFMDNYLTNGGRSIPKVVIFKTDGLEELTTWGPRPEIIQQQILAYKKDTSPEQDYQKFVESIHAWYTKDKNQALEAELIFLFESVAEQVKTPLS